jgi:hypothetical protein
LLGMHVAVACLDINYALEEDEVVRAVFDSRKP